MHEELTFQTIPSKLIEEDVFDYGLKLEFMV